jgi:uncharacterized protein YigA (DUF484 family)
MRDMSNEPDNAVLRYLRRIDEKLDRLAEDVRDLKGRMTTLETQMGLVQMGLARQSEHIDRMEIRLERIERRLDLIEGVWP